MITHLKGIVEEKTPTRLVLDVNGVGYELLISLQAYDRLPAVGASCMVLTVLHVREDAQQLFGFLAAEEREMFRLLTSVSGIGPKLALGALSGLSLRELRLALAEGDVKRLSSISGVGRKTAERMVVELRDKIGTADMLEAVAGAGEDREQQTRLRDAMLALISLGYKEDAARKMVKEALNGEPPARPFGVEEIIKRALAK